MKDERRSSVMWRVGACAAALLLLAALAWRHDPPSGVLTMTSAWPSPHPQMSELKPVARVTTTDGAVVLAGGPVYFDVAPPTPYETVTVESTVRPQGAATVELGALATADGRHDVGAAYVSNDARDEYVRAGAAQGAVPTVASGEPRAYAVSARGAHRLFARVPAGERLLLSLLVQDMNRQPGADIARLTVFAAESEEPLTSVTLPDDENVTEDWHAAAPRTLTLDWQPAAAGEYWLAFDAPDDVFIRRITTSLAEFGFLGRLYLGDEVGYDGDSSAATVMVSGRHLQAKAMNAEAVQTIAVDGRGLALPSVGATAERELTAPSLVVVPHRGLVITTDGRVALGGVPASLVGEAAAPSVDSVLARVGDVQHQGDGSYRLRATFRVSDLALTPTGTYRFVLNANVPVSATPPTLDAVRLTWQRPALSPGEWLARLFRPDAPLSPGQEPPRPDLVDFDEQIP